MAKLIQLKDKDGYVYPINEVYSTTEQKIGTYEGKILYRKVIRYTNSEAIGQPGKTINIEIPHNIQNLYLITNYKISTTGGAKYFFPNVIGSPSTGTITSLTGLFKYDGATITLSIINDIWSSRTWYFTLEYIKTTD